MLASKEIDKEVILFQLNQMLSGIFRSTTLRTPKELVSFAPTLATWFQKAGQASTSRAPPVTLRSKPGAMEGGLSDDPEFWREKK